MDAKLRFEQVSVQFRNDDDEALHALQGLSLALAPGESVAIIGPSGCGKSTLLRLAAGLLTVPAAEVRGGTARCVTGSANAFISGQVLVDGAPLERPRSETALILQNYGLLPWKTVYQNAELGLRIRHIPREERRVRAEAALAAVGLSGFARSYPAQLSGGMQQRVALARALALEVDLLLMDEPLSALDAVMREQLQDLLLALWQQRGYAQLMVTHAIDEAAYLGRRIAVMAPRPGRIVELVDNPGVGTPDYRRSREYFTVCNRVRAALDAVVAQADAEGGLR